MARARDAPALAYPFLLSKQLLTRLLIQRYQALLDQSTPYVIYRWVGTGAFLFLFFLRILLAQGWYIGECTMWL